MLRSLPVLFALLLCPATALVDAPPLQAAPARVLPNASSQDSAAPTPRRTARLGTPDGRGASAPPGEASPPDRADFRGRLELADFERFAAAAEHVRSVKVIIDRRPAGGTDGRPRLYFLNSRVYDLHITFLRQNRLIPKDQLRNVQLETWRSDDRRFVFAQLARYEEVGAPPRYVVELFDEDRASASLIAEVIPLIASHVSFGPIAFKPNSLEQDSRRQALVALGIPVLANDALNTDRLFQVVHAGRPAVGRLRVVLETDPAVVENMIFNRDEIVLLQTIPNDITRVAGVITTRPTTPLSHVSLRARTWDIPNVMLRNALSIAYQEGLEDAWVRLEVSPDGRPLLRRANPAEIDAAAAEKAARAPEFRIPPADLSATELVDLYALRKADVVRVGTKAANLGELSSLTRALEMDDLDPVLAAVKGNWLETALGTKLPRHPRRLKPAKRAKAYLSRLNVPPGFGIPFSAYQEFLDYPPNQKLKAAIRDTLADPKLPQDAVYRKQRLEALQELLRAGQVPPELGRRILERIHQDLPDRRLFIRSSTNCEDLEGFNGAGLYETVGNVEGDQAILEAIKRVWASIWGFKAFEARTDAGIRHDAVYPGILVQQAVRPFAAGVLITKDVLDADGGYRFYLNANPGFGENTVNSGRGAPEQVYADPASGDVRRISLSERGGDLLTDAEVRQLTFFAAIVERHFGRLAGRFPFPQDIEWLVVDGQVSLVQTRPYLEPKRR